MIGLLTNACINSEQQSTRYISRFISKGSVGAEHRLSSVSGGFGSCVSAWEQSIQDFDCVPRIYHGFGLRMHDRWLRHSEKFGKTSGFLQCRIQTLPSIGLSWRPIVICKCKRIWGTLFYWYKTTSASLHWIGTFARKHWDFVIDGESTVVVVLSRFDLLFALWAQFWDTGNKYTQIINSNVKRHPS